jgi:hypothetical protein
VRYVHNPAQLRPCRLEGTNALEAATQHAFASLVGESFTVQTAKKSVGSVTLLSVKSLSSAPTRSGPGLNKPRLVGRVPKLPVQPSVSFALQFQASGSQLSQGSYIFGHPSLGSFPLFIVPSGLATATYTLTAVINQLKTPDKN